MTEIDPIKAMEAVMDGFKVMKMREAAAVGDVFITVTGCPNVITRDDFLQMKEGAICCNAGHFDVEVDMCALRKLAVEIKPARRNIMGYTLPNGRKIYVIAEDRLVNLAAGDGHPAERLRALSDGGDLCREGRRHNGGIHHVRGLPWRQHRGQLQRQAQLPLPCHPENQRPNRRHPAERRNGISLSGETTAFFPYCREETGGGYDFTAYLDPTGEKGQKIDHVGIIWQSTNGGNTVNYSSSATGYNNAKPTFGTLYQWGRKDPFPPITKHLAVTNYGGSGTAIGSYGTTTVGNYFDNSNEAVTIGATYAPDSLFHSVPGTERKEFGEMIPLTIQNPTVFYASTKSVNYSSTSYVDSNLASYMAEPKDGNWILDSDSDHFNRLWGGLDPEKDMTRITKSYDTGLTCKIGNTSGIPIHIYDDYGEKSIFDPCPYGWRVSPPDLWLGFTIDGLNAGSSLNNVNYNTDNTLSNFSGMTMYMTAWREGDSSFFPCQGTRASDGSPFRSGQCGNYNNATADANDRVNTLHIHNNAACFNVFENEYMSYYVKASAGPLRCVNITSVQE